MAMQFVYEYMVKYYESTFLNLVSGTYLRHIAIGTYMDTCCLQTATLVYLTNALASL